MHRVGPSGHPLKPTRCHSTCSGDSMTTTPHTTAHCKRCRWGNWSGQGVECHSVVGVVSRPSSSAPSQFRCYVRFWRVVQSQSAEENSDQSSGVRPRVAPLLSSDVHGEVGEDGHRTCREGLVRRENGKLIVTNSPAADLGESVMATPAIADNKLYVRSANSLWAFGRE